MYPVSSQEYHEFLVGFGPKKYRKTFMNHLCDNAGRNNGLAFGCWPYSDQCLIYGWHVPTSWVKCLQWINQPD